MKKQAFGIFTVLTLLLVLTTATVHAQSKGRSINIPFSFTVGQKTLPPGEYTVQPHRRDSQNVWVLEAGQNTALFATIPVWGIETQEKNKLVFNKYNDQYFLSQVWRAGDNGGREIPAPRLEQQLAKNGVQREKIVIALGAIGQD